MKMTNTSKITALLLGLLAIVLSSCGPAPQAERSKEEIIAKAWTAMFGETKKEDLKSLSVESFFHGSTRPNLQTVLRPNCFRNEVAGEGVLVFDGKRAAWAERGPDEKGNPRNPELIEAAYWRHFEIDIAILFPAFFDHPSDYQGRETIDGKETHRFRVNLPLGGYVTYFVDAESFLVTRRLVNWDGVQGQDWENIVDSFVKYDGVLFPAGFRYPGRNGMETGMYQNAKINVNPPEESFKIPDVLNR